MYVKLFFIVTLVGLLVGLIGCESEAPTDQTAEKIEEAMEKAQKNLEADPQGPVEGT